MGKFGEGKLLGNLVDWSKIINEIIKSYKDKVKGQYVIIINDYCGCVLTIHYIGNAM